MVISEGSCVFMVNKSNGGGGLSCFSVKDQVDRLCQMRHKARGNAQTVTAGERRVISTKPNESSKCTMNRSASLISIRHWRVFILMAGN
jgi:hypothetical protein